MKLTLYGSTSRCCRSPSQIVRSREGGFVTQNCTSCGKPRALPKDEIPELVCPACRIELITFINSDKNYAYKCRECNLSSELASLVPHWSEVFDYSGYALEGEEIFSDQRITSTIEYNSLLEELSAIKRKLGIED
jgi:hypothetical protein